MTVRLSAKYTWSKITSSYAEEDWMEVGWMGYNSLRRSCMAPIGAIDQYYPMIRLWSDVAGEQLHWISLKYLEPGAELPDASAEPDEQEAFAKCVHYGDAFRPVAKWVNSLPSRGRWYQIGERIDRLDLSLLKYDIPYLDVIIVECSGMMGAAYVIDAMLRLMHRENPNLGIILYDQDMAASYVWSKLYRWHPNPRERVIWASHHLHPVFSCQTVMLTPHLAYRQREPTLRNEGVAYVGNDYLRREPMLRLLSGPRFHHYGRLKWEFEPSLRNAGVTLHGPIAQTAQCTIEDVYAHWGTGVQMVREDGYRYNYFSARLSEIARAGALAWCDRNFAIGRTLCGEWCQVQDSQEILAKLDSLPQCPEFWEQTIRYQQAALGYYTSEQRYFEAAYNAAAKLCEGPLPEYWQQNLYCDLLANSGLGVWGGEGESTYFYANRRRTQPGGQVAAVVCPP
jgi:hypothetical protein